MSEHSSLPYFASGEVIKGFGRGSKQLGCPTANYPVEVVNSLPPDINNGVYYGWASVNGGPVYKMVMSVGWNPYYNNTVKSMETHIMHNFPSDFYGSQLRVCIVGFLRPQKNFNSLDELIDAIKNDIEEADKKLEDAEYKKYANDKHFIQENGLVQE